MHDGGRRDATLADADEHSPDLGAALRLLPRELQAIKMLAYSILA